MAALNFDANTVDPTDTLPTYELIPAGNYLTVVETSELQETKNKTGIMLNLKLNILDGPYRDRKLFARINVKNDSATAQEIGQRLLSQLCHAAGKLIVQDTEELHLIPVVSRVTIKKDKNGQYDDRNEIREFKPVSGGATAAPTTRPAFQQPAGAATPTPPPQTPKPASSLPVNTSRPSWVKG